MNSLTDVLAAIDSEKPDIVMFGEHHYAGTRFHQFIFDTLPQLQVKGFQHLALELRDEFEPVLGDVCAGRLDHEAFTQEAERICSGDLGQLSSFDQSFLQAIKRWVCSSGKLCFINSRDPLLDDSTNDRGREQFMHDRISPLRSDRVVVVVGKEHTLVRNPNDVYLDHAVISHLDLEDVLLPWSSASVAEQAIAKQKCLQYSVQTAAEKLAKTGISLYTIGELRPEDELGYRFSMDDGIFFRHEISDDHNAFQYHFNAGDGEFLAPELVYQAGSVGLRSWNCLFVDNSAIPERTPNNPKNGYRCHRCWKTWATFSTKKCTHNRQSGFFECGHHQHLPE